MPRKVLIKAGRAGAYIDIPGGHRAFVPAPMPPNPPVEYNTDMVVLLAEAERELTRLDAAMQFVRPAESFVDMYTRKEAVESSRIEGTQTTMRHLLEHERGVDDDVPRDVVEVANYMRATTLGVAKLKRSRISLALLKSLHVMLLTGVRGSEQKSPGQLRTSQNYIGRAGPRGVTISFVPPPPEAVPRAMADLIRFIHDPRPMPLLVRTALAHLQFETIHPFRDGNGRIGRLLITLMLLAGGAIRGPSLYLSDFFLQHRREYYARLQAGHDGDFEDWIRFFLRGVRDVSRAGTAMARRIEDLYAAHHAIVAVWPHGVTVLDVLIERPVIRVQDVRKAIDRTFPVANTLVARFVDAGLLQEISGGARNRVFVYGPYVDLFDPHVEPDRS